MEFLARLTDFIWSPWLLGLFLLTGLVYSLGSGFFQIFGFRLWLRSTLGSLFHGRKKAGGGLSSLQLWPPPWPPPWERAPSPGWPPP